MFFSSSLKKLICFLQLSKHVVNTWCHCTPADTPTSRCRQTAQMAVRDEHKVDEVAPASDCRWQGGANTLASDHNIAKSGGATTALLHQSCPVAVRDCQVVEATGGIIIDVESSEF